jgi:hypothetical protein
MSDEWRVEAELDDERHGSTLGEGLSARELDDEARERLGGRVIVTRDGSRVFLYSSGEAEAREAERVVRELVTENELTAEIRVTRWHPVEEAWRDADVPLPASEEERRAERERHEAAEIREVAREGEFDWEVRVELPGHRETVELGRRLESEHLPVTRRWRYLLVGALTEEQANELAERILTQAPEGTSYRIEANFDAPTHPLFVFLESR